MMNSLAKKSGTLFIAFGMISGGGVMPALAQYSCPPREIQASDEVSGIKFEAKGCQRQERKIVCQVWLTATEQDISLEVVRDSRPSSSFMSSLVTRMVDPDGNEYIPTSIKSGDREVKGDYASVRLTKDTPLKVISTFMNIPTSVKDVNLLEVAATLRRKDYIGKLRNLKITEGRVESTQVPAQPTPKKKK